MSLWCGMTHVLCQHYWSIIEVAYAPGLAGMLVNIFFLFGYISDTANNQYDVGVLSVRAQFFVAVSVVTKESAHMARL